MRRPRAVWIAPLAFGIAALWASGSGCADTQEAQRTNAGYLARNKIAHELVARGDWGRAFELLDALHRERPAFQLARARGLGHLRLEAPFQPP